MREALRGALLSALFFGLMIGGAPTMVVANDGGATSVTAEHNSGSGWPHYGGDGHTHPPPPPPDPCELPEAIQGGGAAVFGVGGAISLGGGGVLGGMLMTIGGMMTAVGVVVDAVLDC